MNKVHNFKLITSKSTQKLKFCPKVTAKISKVEILSKVPGLAFAFFIIKKVLK